MHGHIFTSLIQGTGNMTVNSGPTEFLVDHHLLDHLAALEIAGGVVYDALLLHVAWQAGADQVVTLNARGFRRVHPALADRIISPLET